MRAGVLLALLLGLLQLLLGGRAEWVEIPQFSDQQKVYRSPVQIHDKRRPHYPDRQQQQQQQQQQQFPNRPSSNRRLYQMSTIGPMFFDDNITFHREPSLRNVSGLTSSRRPSSFPSSEPTHVGTISTFTTERISLDENEEEDVEAEEDEGVEVQLAEDQEEQIKPLDEPPVFDDSSSDDMTVTLDPMEATTTSSMSGSTKNSQYANETENDKGFLDYLPIDLLKRVHKTLKSQPPNLRGKIRFLKMFERTLVSEIESRLSAALAPSRLPRGARHDEGEEGIGFPSLEGTLMAISFLTFAVYLVRLVMMLFRSAGNGGAAPIFIGRKRRSVDEFNEETARILSYLDSALPRHY